MEAREVGCEGFGNGGVRTRASDGGARSRKGSGDGWRWRKAEGEGKRGGARGPVSQVRQTNESMVFCHTRKIIRPLRRDRRLGVAMVR